MILKEITKLFNKIRKVHPEANNAEVVMKPKDHGHVTYVRYDTKHKPPKVILED